MIHYPVDLNKPFRIFANYPQEQILAIHGYMKEINTRRKGNYGGSKDFALISYKQLPLSEADKHWIRLARKHGDKDCERDIYARAITALRNKAIYHG